MNVHDKISAINKSQRARSAAQLGSLTIMMARMTGDNSSDKTMRTGVNVVRIRRMVMSDMYDYTSKGECGIRG